MHTFMLHFYIKDDEKEREMTNHLRHTRHGHRQKSNQIDTTDRRVWGEGRGGDSLVLVCCALCVAGGASLVHLLLYSNGSLCLF